MLKPFEKGDLVRYVGMDNKTFRNKIYTFSNRDYGFDAVIDEIGMKYYFWHCNLRLVNSKEKTRNEIWANAF